VCVCVMASNECACVCACIIDMRAMILSCHDIIVCVCVCVCVSTCMCGVVNFRCIDWASTAEEQNSTLSNTTSCVRGGEGVVVMCVGVRCVCACTRCSNARQC
jgi:hypothetical protein